MGVITELVVYPVKSCGGISVQSALMTPSGLAWDRRWMVVDAATGRFMSQRTHPKMALIKTGLRPELMAGELPAEGDALVLSADGVDGSVAVTLALPRPPPTRPASVWAWSGNAADEGDAAAEWLSKFLGRPARLVRYLGSLDAAAPDAAAALVAGAVAAGGSVAGAEGARSSIVREVDPSFVPWGAEVAFADGFPVLLVAEESMADLNARLPPGQGPLRVNRANVITSGAGAAWGEDGWGVVRLGGGGGKLPGGASAGSGSVEVALVKPCSRCTVPLVEQETGRVTSKEPIRTMQGFRTGSALGFDDRFGGSRATFFGTNGQPMGTGVLHVGDPVALLKRATFAPAA